MSRLASFLPTSSNLVLAALLVAAPALAQQYTLRDFPTDEAYIRLMNDRPADFQADWMTDFNGVTHDDTHW